MTGVVTVDDLVAALGDDDELALLDAREQGAYSESHLLFAVNLPRSRAEITAPRLLPRRDVRIIITDEGGGEAADVADRLESLGWSDVAVLLGGNRAWAEAGHELYSGVNVPSKLFGELVERHYGTPHVQAAELRSWLDDGRPMVVLDSRTEREYRRMSIPTGQSCPGGELVRRVFDLVPDDETTVVVNCAGRTRSIMGAQSLRSAGVRNPVVALENGTMGWELADLELDHGAERVAPEATDAGRARASAAANQVAERVGVRRIPLADALALHADATRTSHLLDVRTPAEFEAGHLPGSTHAAGGQLVQATDEYMAVRGAMALLIDDDGTRATMAASWLQQMGWDVAVVEGALDGDLESGPVPDEDLVDLPPVVQVSPDGVGDAVVLDLSTSAAHRRGHLPGAIWAVRGRLAALSDVIDPQRLVLTSPDGVVAALAAREAQSVFPGAAVEVLDGGFDAWSAAGGQIEEGLATDQVVDDVWALPYDPGDAEVAREAMHGYLVWEVALVEQYDNDPLAHFPLAGEPVGH